jgi:hypothetical protein
MRLLIRSTLMIAGMTCLLGGEVMAATAPVTGLGQSWPNATDVSASPHYHVYVFQHLGVRYIQVNDASGTVRGAVAYGGSGFMGLPMGVDATRWVTPTEGVWDGAAMASGEQVYNDGTVIVTAAPQPDGTSLLSALPEDCKNPAECSVPGP